MRFRPGSSMASGLICACATWLAPLTASAQASAAPKPPTSADAPAAPASASPEAATSSAPPAPAPEVLLEAKQRFDRGYELYEEGEHSLALIEFNRAYELVPNYRVLYNIGQVCIQLGQYANAKKALTQYRDEGGDELSTDRRAAVAKDLEMLERRTAHLMITSNVSGAEVLVDDVVVGRTPLDAALLVDAGVHRVTLRYPGYQPRTSRVILAGGDEQTASLQLEKLPEGKQTIVVRERPAESDKFQTLMIAGWATTGALTAGAIVAGLMGAGEANELEKLRKSDPREVPDLASRMDDTKSNASSLLLAADIFAGAAVVVGGLSLWLTLSPPESEQPPSLEQPAPTPREPTLQVGYERGQLKLRGQF